MVAPISVVVIDGAGPSPIVNHGQIIDTQTLLGLLDHALNESNFTSVYNTMIQGAIDGITQLQSDVSSNDSDISSIVQDLVDNVNDHASYEQRLGLHDTDIADINIGLAAVAVAASTNTQDISLLTNTVATLDLAVQENSTSIDNLEAAGSSSRVAITYQDGVCANADNIILDGLWGSLPKVDLSFLRGSTYSQADAADDQELFIGHSGVKETATEGWYEFTFYTGLLVKSVMYTNSLAWDSSEETVTYPVPDESVTTESSLETVNSACIGLRFIGELRLKNLEVDAVAGTIELQVQINGGDWQVLGSLYQIFNIADTAWTTKPVDVAFVLNQAIHTYKFRGVLTSSYAPSESRILTGQVNVSSIEESGSGVVISNDLQAKWQATAI